jgi:hypothetical protein
MYGGNSIPEVVMYPIISFKSEWIIDRSLIHNPYLLVLLTVIGEEFVQGSPWVAVKKKVARRHNLLRYFLVPQKPVAA